MSCLLAGFSSLNIDSRVTQFTEALECPSLASDPRFIERDQRMAGFANLAVALSAIAAQQPRSHGTARLADCDVLFAPVNDVRQAMVDPQVRHPDGIFTIRNPEHRAVKAIDINLIGVNYAVMIAAWSYLIVDLLAIGTRRHQRRLSVHEYDDSWSIRDIRSHGAAP